MSWEVVVIHIQSLLQHYGMFGVFAMLFLEAIGIPFPAETTLVTAGVMLARSFGVTASLVVAGALGNIIGSSIAYVAGRYLGRPILLKFGRFVGITEPRLARVEHQFQRNSTLFLIGGKFIAFVRIVVPYLAGINEVNVVRFSILNAAAAIVWASLFITLGKTVEGVWQRYKLFFERHIPITVAIVVLIVLVIVGIRWLEKRGHRKSSQGADAKNGGNQ